jgi:pantothenate kinase
VIDFAELAARAARLAGTGRRAILGIAGPPGAGKSSLAGRLVAELGSDRAVVIGLDGFHLSDALLRASGLRDRKGAPETFDRDGYVALLRRLREASSTVYAPAFDRALEDSIAAAVAVPTAVPLVITEGNYLLYWPEIAGLLDQVWFLAPDPAVRRRLLIERHVAFGKSLPDAQHWTDTSDERNAELIEAGRSRADLVLDWPLS